MLVIFSCIDWWQMYKVIRQQPVRKKHLTNISLKMLWKRKSIRAWTSSSILAPWRDDVVWLEVSYITSMMMPPRKLTRQSQKPSQIEISAEFLTTPYQNLNGFQKPKKSWTVTNWQREIVTGTGIYTKVWISYLSNYKMDTIDENKLNLGSHFSFKYVRTY